MSSYRATVVLRFSEAVLLACALWTAVGLASAEPAEAPLAAEAATSAERQRGDDALAAAELEQARQAYLAAYQQAPSFAVAANLGGVELELGRADDAATHLAAALRLFPADGDAEVRARIKRLLGRAEQAGGRASSPAAEPVAKADESVPVPKEDDRLPWLMTGTALAIAGVAAGTGLLVASQQHNAWARGQGAALDGMGLADPCADYPDTCDEIQARQDSRDRYTAGAIAAYAAGGLALGGTILYGLLATGADDGSGSSSTRPHLQARPPSARIAVVGSPSGDAGLVLRGCW